MALDDISKHLTILLTTNTMESAPSTELIENTLMSIRSRLKGSVACKTLIYCDTDVRKPNHKEYIENLQMIENVGVIDERNGGLQKNYLNGVLNSKTPFVLCCEHDWLFLRDIDLRKLIAAMINHSSINFVRFNKRDNHLAHINNPEKGDADFWETYIEEDSNILEQKLIKTNCIATHPHIIRNSKLKESWLNIARTPRPGIIGAVELNLYEAYSKDINEKGFNIAHKDWGIYNYGAKSDKKIITHTDGSSSGRK